MLDISTEDAEKIKDLILRLGRVCTLVENYANAGRDSVPVELLLNTIVQ